MFEYALPCVGIMMRPYDHRLSNGDPFAQVQPPRLPQEETLSTIEMANTHTHYMANAYTKFMDEINQAP